MSWQVATIIYLALTVAIPGLAFAAKYYDDTGKLPSRLEGITFWTAMTLFLLAWPITAPIMLWMRKKEAGE